MKKYRDAEGCILLRNLVDNAKTQVCPKEFEPQIRPLTIGTLDEAKTAAKRKQQKDLCCYSWKTLGNR